MTGRPDLARRALAATQSNVVPLILPDRHVRRRHLVCDAPVWFAEAKVIEEWGAARSAMRQQDLMSLRVAARCCLMPLSELTANLGREPDLIDDPGLLLAMAGARRRFEGLAAVLRIGRDRFAAALMDASE